MLELQNFQKQYIGSSFPTLIEANDGLQYVLKMKGAGNGARSLLREYIVNRCCAQIGFQVPNVYVVRIPQDYGWHFGTDEFDDIVQRSYGPNLGIEYISGAEPVSDLSAMRASDDLIAQLLTIDLFFRNLDRTHQSRNIILDKSARYWLVDHGNCEFIHLQTLTNAASLPQNHFLYAQFEQVPALVDNLLNFDFSPILADIPNEWLAEARIETQAIHDSLEFRKKIMRMQYRL